ncbi:MAG: metal ABC transporter substrate-binding protein [Nitrospiraceae bacterium]
MCTSRSKCILITALLLGLTFSFPITPARSAEPLPIVVTLPVLKDWTQEIGGVHVSVTSLMTGYESEHTYSPKPSDLIAVRKARILVEVGAGLEVWVATLVKNAGNSQLLIVTTSQGIDLLPDHDVAEEKLERGHEQHQQGNPHIWLDPSGASIMVRHITDALIDADPMHALDYRTNSAAYLARLDQLQAELVRRVQGISDRRIVVHHPAWPYFARHFRFHIVGTLLTQPGAEPSARRVHDIARQMKKDGIKVIVSEVQLNQKLPQLLARETGARVAILTTLPGAVPGTETYLDMLRYNVLQLADALEKGEPRAYSQPPVRESDRRPSLPDIAHEQPSHYLL